jgi:hypothetical protein
MYQKTRKTVLNPKFPLFLGQETNSIEQIHSYEINIGFN